MADTARETTDETTTDAAPHVCFDRILPQDLMRPHRRERGADGADRAISPIGKAWPNGSRLTVSFTGGTAAERNTARTEAAVVGAGLQPQLRLRRPHRGRPAHHLRPERRRLVLRRHRLQEHPRRRADDEPRLPRRRHVCARVRARHRSRARALQPGRRHPVERAGRHRGPREATEPVGRGEGAAQRLPEVRGRPDQGDAVRPRLDHALRLPGGVDAQRRRDPRERRAVEPRQGVRVGRRDVSAHRRPSSATPRRSSSTGPRCRARSARRARRTSTPSTSRRTGSTSSTREGRRTSTSSSTGPTARRRSSRRTTTAATGATRRSAARSTPGRYLAQVRHYTQGRDGELHDPGAAGLTAARFGGRCSSTANTVDCRRVAE